jgi:glucose/arabinose dehydrogenase
VAIGQGGLLDVALAPDFATSSTIFLSYAQPRSWLKNGTAVARARLVMGAGDARLDELQVIFEQEPGVRSFHHFGSRLVFARDGTLFVTTGERSSEKDEAQNPASHLGKVIHITAGGAPAPGNPNLPGWDPKVWSIGHRNMQGAALDPESGDLFTIEHGARGGDELNRTLAGKNYGWPVITWGIDYSGEKIGKGTAKEGLEQPVYYWNPSIAVSGLAVYTASLFPDWKGNIFVGALNGAHLHRLAMKDGHVVGHERLLSDLGERIRDVRQGPDGALWLLTDSADGRVLRLTPGE